MIGAGLRHDQEERIGWCPVCFGEHVTELMDGGPALALHGYQRPGRGSIVGRCLGSGEVPLDVSPDGLKRSVDRMTIRLAELVGATAPGAAEERRSLEVRIAFARRELADWRPGEEISGLRRRRQPAMGDDEIRLRLDSDIAARKRLPPLPDPPKDVRPFLSVVLNLPNPLADEAERRRGEAPPDP